ncbi:uncharacterized protein LAESUDRAFT_762092 [Laetiporus sulphureus 93-53]|uniref:Uncharacterized protein n=1 Tax=Laetiporus sulphureus 93-53 TaxID=1314785 RepID=A0A165CRQ3_9APHY|nr:uncharacterized protein LAESUDRAFT_762092 [Laetiporus sulphureus 93-53]KZT03313.1 hypothetical protein LAESUDRAFT_762092 [Laetiporus sulphureus 93-53]
MVDDVTTAITTLHNDLETQLTTLEVHAKAGCTWSYAMAVISSHPADPAHAPNPPSCPKASELKRALPPKHASAPVQYVVRWSGKMPEHLISTPPAVTLNDVNWALALISTTEGLTTLAAYPSTTGNLVLVFLPATSHTRIDAHLPTIHLALGIGADQTISRDSKWSRVLLGNVYTRTFPSAEVHSPSALSEELLKNPAINACLSVVLGFEDSDGTALATILCTLLFTFSAHVTTSRWCEKRISDSAQGIGHMATSPKSASDRSAAVCVLAVIMKICIILNAPHV